MAMITLDVTSQQLEDIMYALKLRTCQVPRRAGNRSEGDTRVKTMMEDARQQMNAQGEAVFGWNAYPDRFADDGSIRVTVTSRNRW